MVYHQQNSTKCGSALETVAAEEILGEWKGDDFATGHRLHEKLSASRWYGKTFNSVEDAKPLICRDEDGNLYSTSRAAMARQVCGTSSFVVK